MPAIGQKSRTFNGPRDTWEKESHQTSKRTGIRGIILLARDELGELPDVASSAIRWRNAQLVTPHFHGTSTTAAVIAGRLSSGPLYSGRCDSRAYLLLTLYRGLDCDGLICLTLSLFERLVKLA